MTTRQVIKDSGTETADRSHALLSASSSHRWVESGFGTGDCVIIADGTLSVIDYKHGKGMLVAAENNP